MCVSSKQRDVQCDGNTEIHAFINTLQVNFCARCAPVLPTATMSVALVQQKACIAEVTFYLASQVLSLSI